VTDEPPAPRENPGQPALAEDAALAEHAPPGIDVSAPHSARIWNYWLGGKDNYAVDRAVGDQVRQIFPGIVRSAQTQRAFLARAISYLAGEAGIRQFLDIGTGLPAAENTHQIAQRIAPGCRVVYVDNDPVVLTHARALLRGTPEDTVSYLDADLRDPGRILGLAAATLDFTRPVALILLGILGHMSSHEEAMSIVGRLVAALASGSYLVAADGVDTSPEGNVAQEQYNQRSPNPYHLRGPDQVAAYFTGLELVAPGVVSCSRWRPGEGAAEPEYVPVHGGVARKP